MRRAPRLFGHPIHPMFSDFPLALWASSIVWDGLALVHGAPMWWALAFRTQVLGLVALVPTAITGLMDLVAVPDGVAATTGRWHMIVMLAATCAYGTSAIVRGGSAPLAGARLWGGISASVVGLVLLGIGGWLGGHLVFHHGVGQQQRNQ